MIKPTIEEEVERGAVEITLRPATYDDWSFLLDLANEPEVASTSGYSAPIPVVEHKKWFRSKLSDANCRIMIVMLHGEPVGQIRSDRLDGMEVISVGVTKLNRGKGFGSVAIRLHCSRPGRYVAFIVENNRASVKAFANANFEECGHDGKGRLRMELEA
jgi:UDP-2,4-diacetamido-2,4,6-trideoxy-beta-L-altropyranose hydrolase